MTADLNTLGAILAVNMYMQDAAAAHFCALLAEEPRAVSTRDQSMAHHECRQWSGRASSGWIFGDTVFGREHPRIGPIGGRRENEDAFEFRVRTPQQFHACKVNP